MGTLLMSKRERRRLEVMARVRDGEITLVTGAELMSVSYRQAKRIYKRYREEGDAGLVHRLRGRPSNHGGHADRRERVVAIYQERYGDFGPTLAAEYLEREDGIAVAVETLRQWLIGSGDWVPRRRKETHRSWRPRREHLGDLVQTDGSHHDWFEGRRETAVLMVMVDDATSRLYARFFESESTASVFETFKRYARLYGLPRALYVDHSTIYHVTRDASIDDDLAGRPPLTQMGRAMADLGVELILASSPQAKGRVERFNGTLQDRLVKAMRLRGIVDLQAANDFLDQEFLADFNQRFTVPPARMADLHVPLDEELDLDDHLCFCETRVVQRDWTIAWRRRYLQIEGNDASRGIVGERIMVREHLDGTISLVFRGRELAWHELPQRPDSKPPQRPESKPRTPRKPPAKHPWRGRMIPEKPEPEPAPVFP